MRDVGEMGRELVVLLQLEPSPTDHSRGEPSDMRLLLLILLLEKYEKSMNIDDFLGFRPFPGSYKENSIC